MAFVDALMNETSHRFSKRETISKDLDKVTERAGDDPASRSPPPPVATLFLETGPI